ncbi:hypothetical protein LTR99_011017 [Exophiala xenobiotica]|uniref:Uncharacterized protein n=1 Tax=Vermiconidia calcicola TaxID=1690605 RepID=A0AAV9PTD4_9PEZI|nr:hypothetical protein LTR99_011017 [Exophiala xenobiotica]KAK5425570.1 hypothetical protein LTR34_010994 [Exophiala xenobiotica]KAK5527700.1 hypothetical protein LTR25_010978 [Vermiconidia calcicola]KAK5528185.1 hypothetical protein LTR23_011092 [Chaetothyriales sp. CCFEE 6169]
MQVVQRGWTLQESIAPASVEFFSREGEYLGMNTTPEQQIHEITGIPVAALRGSPLSQSGSDERMRWAAECHTTKREDKAYCSQGIFNVFIPVMYGEGENASIRLREDIEKRLGRKLDLEKDLSQSCIYGLVLSLGGLPASHHKQGLIHTAVSPLRPDLSARGKNIIVTGGGTGIGKAIAVAFAQAGAASVTILGRREDRLKTAAKEIGKNATNGATTIVYKVTDLMSCDETDAAFQSITDAWMLQTPGGIAGYDSDEFMRELNVNVLSAWNAVQAFLPLATPERTIINISARPCAHRTNARHERVRSQQGRRA